MPSVPLYEVSLEKPAKKEEKKWNDNEKKKRDKWSQRVVRGVGSRKRRNRM